MNKSPEALLPVQVKHLSGEKPGKIGIDGIPHLHRGCLREKKIDRARRFERRLVQFAFFFEGFQLNSRVEPVDDPPDVVNIPP